MHFPPSPTLGQIETVMGRQYQYNGEGWDPIEIDPMAVYTAADVLTKIKTVDGAGSGLDADKLDGQEGAYYLDLANATGVLPVEHLPTLTKSDVGLANVDNTSDADKPVSTAQQTALGYKLDRIDGIAQSSFSVEAAGNATLTIEADTDNVSETDVATLVFMQDGGLTVGQMGLDSTNAFYIQPKNAGAQTDSVFRKNQAGTLYQMWDAGNDGAASGLDADLLDGQQGSYYLDSANLTGTILDARLSSNVALKNAANTWSSTNTFSGAVTMDVGGNALTLKAGASNDHVYMSFYADSQALTTRSGYFGYGTGGSPNMVVVNEMTDGHISFNTVGTGKVRVGTNEIWHAGNDGAGSGLDADLLDGVQGTDFARLVASTATGDVAAGNGANTWAKLASYDCVGQFQDGTFIYALTNTTASSVQTAMISVYVRSNATGAAPTLSVDYISAHGNSALADDSFKLIANNNNTGYELWVKKTTTYQQFALFEVARRIGASTTVTYFSNSAWTATVPVGSIVNSSSSGLNFRANAVWHAGNFTPSSKLDTSGTAAQATKLATARNINGVAFDGTADISISAAAAWGSLTGTLSTQTDLNNALNAKATAADTWVHKGLIGASVDLNTYTTVGIYHQNTNANAASGTNYPAPFAGMLTVYAQAAMVYQTYQIYNTGERYHRSWYSTAWSAWRKTVSSDAGTFTGSIATTSGSIDSFNNTVGTQSLKFRAGWSNSIARWNQVLEPDATYAFYGYDTAGANPSRIMQLASTPAGGSQYAAFFGQVIANSSTYPTFKMYASTNPLNQKRGNTYLDTNGDLVLNVTDDADAVSYGTFKLKRDGSSAASGILTTPLLIAGDGNGTESVRVGNDASLWDVNVAHTMGIKSVSDNTKGLLTFGSHATPFGYDGTTFGYAGNFSIGSTGTLTFGTGATRQMLNMWSSIYGIGIQNNTMYFRTGVAAGSANGGFAWFRGGVHDVNIYNPGTGGTKLAHIDGNGSFNTIGELQSTNANAIRMVQGNYGVMFRQDGPNTYILMTASGDQYGTWNSLRPLSIDNATGNVGMAHNLNVTGTLTGGVVVGSTRIYTGWDSGVAGSVSCDGWFRSNGNTGLYCSTWAGGIYMTDATYLRSYNNKAMAASDFVISSDERLKAGIRPFEYKGRLRPVHYVYRKDGRKDFGFIAQDVQKLYPEAVSSGKGDGHMLKLSYPKLTAVLSHQVNHLEDKVDQLESRLGKLQQRLEEQQMFDEYLSR